MAREEAAAAVAAMNKCIASSNEAIQAMNECALHQKSVLDDILCMTQLDNGTAKTTPAPLFLDELVT